jgi:hypothetical protein
MASVTDQIKRIIEAKDDKVATGAETLRALLGEVKMQIVEDLATTAAGSYTAATLKAGLASVERYLAGFETAGSAEMGTLLDTAWDAGADLVPDALRLGNISVVFGNIPGSILRTLKDFSFYKISGLASDTFTKIRGELTLGLLGQKTPDQVIRAIAGTLDSPGIFPSLEARAATIARVEMGRAYSAATAHGLREAMRSVPDIGKEWWHAGHPKMPRISHLRANGQRVKADDRFLVGSIPMDHPRDPKAPADEVIGCGCEMLPWHPQWASA